MNPSTRPRVAPFILLLIVGGLAALWLGAHVVVAPAAPPRHPITGRQIAGIATNAAWMDRAEREEEEQPDLALDLVGIGPGLVVADVGAGSGFLTVRIARRVGPGGRVYANDVQPDLLRIIRNKVQRELLSNVQIVQGTDVDARLPERTIDVALLVDVYHELWHPQEMLRSIRRSLKPAGRLVLVEYRKEDRTIPIADTHRMSVADARAEVEAEGFTFDRLIVGLPRQHILVFTMAQEVPHP